MLRPLKEMFHEFSSSKEGRARYNNPVHNSAAVLAAAQFTRAISKRRDSSEAKVLFLTGIPGAGKTSAVFKAQESIPANVRAIYEGQLAKAEPAIEKIQQVLDVGLKPTIVAVHLPPEMALRNTLSRFEKEGRGASIHAMALIQSGLPDGLKAIRDHFGDRVALTVFDRSAGLNNTRELDGWHHIASLQREGNYDRIHERLSQALNLHREGGSISDDAYRQARGLATRPSPDQADSQHVGRFEQLQDRGVASSPSEVWERMTLEKIAFDLKEGISPADIVRNWESWAPEKGAAYFTGLVDKSMSEDQRKTWVVDRSEQPTAVVAPEPPDKNHR